MQATPTCLEIKVSQHTQHGEAPLLICEAAHAYLNTLCSEPNTDEYGPTSGHPSASATPTGAISRFVATASSILGGSTVKSPLPMSTGIGPDPPYSSTSVSNSTDPTISLLSSNQTSNLTIISMTAETPTYTYDVPLTTSVAWNVHFTSAAPKSSIPLFITMMSSLAIILFSGGTWDRETTRRHRIECKKE